MNTKPFWQSKELWVVFIGVINYVFDYFGLPAFKPTAEFYGALLVIVGALRAWWTDGKLGGFRV